MKKYTIIENKIIETTSIEYDRNINFNDIINSIEVEPESESFFDYCDSLRHELVRISIEDAERMGRCNSIIRLSGIPYKIEMDENLFDGVIEYYKNNGYSKQASFEKLAKNKKNSLKIIKDILNGKTEYYQLSISFMGFSTSSIGMIDEDSINESKRDLALELAGQMEDIGFIIKNKPSPFSKKDSFKLRLKTNLSA
jgi:hypothetical protein